MALNVDQFRAVVAAEKSKALKLCSNIGCVKPLGPRVDGEHKQIAGKPVCDDCYFNAFDDATPIGIPRIRRR